MISAVKIANVSRQWETDKWVWNTAEVTGGKTEVFG